MFLLKHCRHLCSETEAKDQRSVLHFKSDVTKSVGHVNWSRECVLIDIYSLPLVNKLRLVYTFEKNKS